MAANPVMRILYSLFLILLTPFLLLRLVWLARRNPEYWDRWIERLGFPSPLPDGRPVIWLHAVSVGEVLAAKPLVNGLLEGYPQYRIVVTTTTPTGALTVRQNFAGNIEHRYFPYDLPFAVTRSLHVIHPSLVIVMETELWPNFYAACADQGVPLALVNARLSEKSARGYSRVPALVRDTLRVTSLIAAQSRVDADRFLSLGANPDRVTVCGNVKFDMHLPHSVREQGQALRRFFSESRPVWIAASTHPGEEAPILDAFGTLLKAFPDSLLVLAPRHPERSDSIEDMSRRAGFTTVRRSRKEQYTSGTQVFILDSLGELPVFYACADIAFVGGSLVSVGGHNLLEPASLGVAVISGPHLFNFSSISELLVSAQAMVVVPHAGKLADTVTHLLQDANLRYSMGERAKAVFQQHQGCTERVLRSLGPFLDAHPSAMRG